MLKKAMKKKVIKEKAKNKVSAKRTSPKKETRVATGVKNFDILVKGGFEQNSVNIIAGTAGSGKSIFATQFIMEGLRNEETCLYVSFFEKKEQFYKNMLDFGWDLDSYEKKGAFTFLEYTPEKIKFMLEEGGGSIETIVLAKKIKRLVIDSISSFMLLYADELLRLESTLALYNMIREWGCTSLLTFEETIDSKSKSEDKFGTEADSVTLMYYLRNGDKRERYIEVLKMRGTEHSNKAYKADIEKNGLVLDSKPVSKDYWEKLTQ